MKLQKAFVGKLSKEISGKQTIVCSPQSVVCSLQSAVCSLQSADCSRSLQSAVCSLQMSETAACRPPGSNDPMEWLKIPPPELRTPDVVVGHGRKFGSPAYFISERTQCKWIHFVHVFCEDLGKHKLEGRSTPDAISDNEEKNKQELELCEAANLVVAVGSRLQRKYGRSLPDIKVEVITPGIFENFLLTRATHVQPAQAEEFSIFMIGRGSIEDFALKGYDIVGKAVALLGKKFELAFVGSLQDEQRTIETWFLEKTNIALNQLTIRGYRDNEEMRKMFLQADVIVMPSRTEGLALLLWKQFQLVCLFWSPVNLG